ncbi:MAG: malonyl-ACP O-methyltransferase BioC [Steroidobacteraceae bacterium]
MRDDGAAAPRLDLAHVRARFSAAGERYDAAARLQAIVRTELLARVAELRIAPRVVLDLGAGTGHAARALKQRYPRSLVVATDLAPGMLAQAGALLGWRERWFGGRWFGGGWGHRFERVAADARALPLSHGCAGLAFSNLMLQWCDELVPAFSEIARALEPGGAFAFTTFGPATLQELRAAWAAVDDAPHVHRFLDMHDVGDALLRAGFEQPVLDVDTHQLDYDSVIDLMRDLQRIGAVNADRDRRRGLLGRRALATLQAAYEPLRAAGRLPSTWEVIYGVAWAPRARPAATVESEPTVAVIPVGQIGQRRRRADGETP